MLGDQARNLLRSDVAQPGANQRVGQLDGYRIALSGASSTEVEHAPGCRPRSHAEAGEVHPGRLDDRLDAHLANVAGGVIGVGHDPVRATDDEAGDPSDRKRPAIPVADIAAVRVDDERDAPEARRDQADEPGRHCDVRLDTPDRAANPHRVDEEERIQQRPPDDDPTAAGRPERRRRPGRGRGRSSRGSAAPWWARCGSGR